MIKLSNTDKSQSSSTFSGNCQCSAEEQQLANRKINFRREKPKVDECSEIERNHPRHTHRVGNRLYYVVDREVRKQMRLGLVWAAFPKNWIQLKQKKSPHVSLSNKTPKFKDFPKTISKIVRTFWDSWNSTYISEKLRMAYMGMGLGSSGGPYVVTPPSDVTVHYISKIL